MVGKWRSKLELIADGRADGRVAKFHFTDLERMFEKQEEEWQRKVRKAYQDGLNKREEVL